MPCQSTTKGGSEHVLAGEKASNNALERLLKSGLLQHPRVLFSLSSLSGSASASLMMEVFGLGR